MTLLGSSIVMYLLIGLGVAGALLVAETTGRPAERWFRVLTAVPFWPLYVPILLAGRRAVIAPPASSPPDAMSAAIAQVAVELEAALSSLDAETKEFLDHEVERIHELPAAWNAQAERIREMIAEYEMPGVGTVTASIGVSNFPVNALGKEDLIRVADQALYVAKDNGRDRVEFFNYQLISR